VGRFVERTSAAVVVVSECPHALTPSGSCLLRLIRLQPGAYSCSIVTRTSSNSERPHLPPHTVGRDRPRLVHQAGVVRSTSRTSSPYLRSFDSPTPDTRSRSARLVGLADAMATSVVSWNTT